MYPYMQRHASCLLNLPATLGFFWGHSSTSLQFASHGSHHCISLAQLPPHSWGRSCYREQGLFNSQFRRSKHMVQLWWGLHGEWGWQWPARIIARTESQTLASHNPPGATTTIDPGFSRKDQPFTGPHNTTTLELNVQSQKTSAAVKSHWNCSHGLERAEGYLVNCRNRLCLKSCLFPFVFLNTTAWLFQDPKLGVGPQKGLMPPGGRGYVHTALLSAPRKGEVVDGLLAVLEKILHTRLSTMQIHAHELF